MSDLRRPAWVERTPARLDGRETTRLIFVFRAIGCSYARRPDGGCTICGYRTMSTRGEPVAEDDLIAQFDSVADAPQAFAGVGEVDLFCSGSFLADQEIPPRVRAHVLDRLGRSGMQRVLIEARPEHVQAEKVAAARVWLGEGVLEVGIGLESADDRVREVLVHKGFGRADFERAVAVLGRGGARLLAYVILGPLGLDERAAVEDAVASAHYVFAVGRSHGVPTRVALEPIFVAPDTLVEREYRAGRYRPPRRRSVVEVVRRVHGAGELVVGLSDEGLAGNLVPDMDGASAPQLRAALLAYNRTGDVHLLDGFADD